MVITTASSSLSRTQSPRRAPISSSLKSPPLTQSETKKSQDNGEATTDYFNVKRIRHEAFTTAYAPIKTFRSSETSTIRTCSHDSSTSGSTKVETPGAKSIKSPSLPATSMDAIAACEWARSPSEVSVRDYLQEISVTFPTNTSSSTGNSFHSYLRLHHSHSHGHVHGYLHGHRHGAASHSRGRHNYNNQHSRHSNNNHSHNNEGEKDKSRSFSWPSVLLLSGKKSEEKLQSCSPLKHAEDAYVSFPLLDDEVSLRAS